MFILKKYLTLHPITKRRGSESRTAYKTTDKSVKNRVKKRRSGKSHDCAEPILSTAPLLGCVLGPEDKTNTNNYILILPFILELFPHPPTAKSLQTTASG